MPQGALAFQYVQEKGSTGMTALAGLGAYLDLWQVAGYIFANKRQGLLQRTL